MAVVFALCAAYFLWCLHRAMRYMRQHSDEFDWQNNSKPAENPSDDGNGNGDAQSSSNSQNHS